MVLTPAQKHQLQLMVSQIAAGSLTGMQRGGGTPQVWNNDNITLGAWAIAKVIFQLPWTSPPLASPPNPADIRRLQRMAAFCAGGILSGMVRGGGTLQVWDLGEVVNGAQALTIDIFNNTPLTIP